MDEPFGALDPITRHRLQTELRRLHRDVGKSIIFVTHDIDEAIQMGDRIAILREGGVLAQYDTPDAILAHPADDFVAQFIGGDRALRRLALRTVGEVPLQALGTTVAAPDDWVASDTTVRNAVSLMLELKTESLAVKDGDRFVGTFRLSDVSSLL
jgi:osmoprotectant transport system ATP-binding protein